MGQTEKRNKDIIFFSQSESSFQKDCGPVFSLCSAESSHYPFIVDPAAVHQNMQRTPQKNETFVYIFLLSLIVVVTSPHNETVLLQDSRRTAVPADQMIIQVAEKPKTSGKKHPRKKHRWTVKHTSPSVH